MDHVLSINLVAHAIQFLTVKDHLAGAACTSKRMNEASKRRRSWGPTARLASLSSIDDTTSFDYLERKYNFNAHHLEISGHWGGLLASRLLPALSSSCSLSTLHLSAMRAPGFSWLGAPVMRGVQRLAIQGFGDPDRWDLEPIDFSACRSLRVLELDCTGMPEPWLSQALPTLRKCCSLQRLRLQHVTESALDLIGAVREWASRCPPTKPFQLALAQMIYSADVLRVLLEGAGGYLTELVVSEPMMSDAALVAELVGACGQLRTLTFSCHRVASTTLTMLRMRQLMQAFQKYPEWLRGKTIRLENCAVFRDRPSDWQTLMSIAKEGGFVLENYPLFSYP